MQLISPYWLEKVNSKEDKTDELGFVIPGCERSADGSAETCPDCHSPLRIAAAFRKSLFIPFEKYEGLMLEVCPACARETDGVEGRNGYYPKLVTRELLEYKLARMPCLLPEPIFIQANRADEPKSRKAFDDWALDQAKPKLGGRQISIQDGREGEKCPRCRSPWVFLASFPQIWARKYFKFGFGMGYTFVCKAECSEGSCFFYWDCR